MSYSTVLAIKCTENTKKEFPFSDASVVVSVKAGRIEVAVERTPKLEA